MGIYREERLAVGLEAIFNIGSWFEFKTNARGQPEEDAGILET